MGRLEAAVGSLAICWSWCTGTYGFSWSVQRLEAVISELRDLCARCRGWCSRLPLFSVLISGAGALGLKATAVECLSTFRTDAQAESRLGDFWDWMHFCRGSVCRNITYFKVGAQVEIWFRQFLGLICGVSAAGAMEYFDFEGQFAGWNSPLAISGPVSVHLWQLHIMMVS